MASTKRGKQWEDKFARDWLASFPGTFLFRIKDQMNGYLETSKNPCDFLTFTGDMLFMVECKEHKGASIPFTAIPQYSRLLEYRELKNVYPGVILWLSEKDLVLWISIDEMYKMVQNGEKSIGIRMLKDKMYNIVEIPSKKRRVFLDSDYSCLVDLKNDRHN